MKSSIFIKSGKIFIINFDINFEMDKRKVAIVGNTGVGKTYLLKKFMGTLSQDEVPSPTNAANFEQAPIQTDNGTVYLEIWDTAGQERFNSIVKMYLRNTHVAFICFDCTSTDSTNVIDWANLVLNVSQYCVLFLVATKSDLLNNQNTEAKIQSFMNKITKSHKEFAATFITSGFNGNNIKELFQKAAEVKLLEQKPEPKPIPLNYINKGGNDPGGNDPGGKCC